MAQQDWRLIGNGLWWTICIAPFDLNRCACVYCVCACAFGCIGCPPPPQPFLCGRCARTICLFIVYRSNRIRCEGLWSERGNNKHMWQALCARHRTRVFECRFSRKPGSSASHTGCRPSTPASSCLYLLPSCIQLSGPPCTTLLALMSSYRPPKCARYVLSSTFSLALLRSPPPECRISYFRWNGVWGGKEVIGTAPTVLLCHRRGHRRLRNVAMNNNQEG